MRAKGLKAIVIKSIRPKVKANNPDDSMADIDADLWADGYEAATVGLDAVTDAGVWPSLGQCVLEPCSTANSTLPSAIAIS